MTELSESFNLKGTFGDHMIQPPVRAGPTWRRLFGVLSSWVLNVSKGGDALTSLGNLCNFLHYLIVVSLFATCICCLLSFHCAPARRVWFCLLYTFLLGSWNQQLDLPFPFSKLNSAVSLPPGKDELLTHVPFAGAGAPLSAKLSSQPTPSLSCCTGFFCCRCNALYLPVLNFEVSVSPRLQCIDCCFTLSTTWWTSLSVIPLNATFFSLNFC